MSSAELVDKRLSVSFYWRKTTSFRNDALYFIFYWQSCRLKPQSVAVFTKQQIGRENKNRVFQFIF